MEIYFALRSGAAAFRQSVRRAMASRGANYFLMNQYEWFFISGLPSAYPSKPLFTLVAPVCVRLRVLHARGRTGIFLHSHTEPLFYISFLFSRSPRDTRGQFTH